jgi:ABC-type bacteriocin/lantibiotic exporter with double-glycine peptidase domain
VSDENAKKKKVDYGNAWEEARGLIWKSRARLTLGLSLMLVNRLVGLVLPASTKFLVDDVIGKGQSHLLWPLAGAVALATVIEAATSFTLSPHRERSPRCAVPCRRTWRGCQCATSTPSRPACSSPA